MFSRYSQIQFWNKKRSYATGQYETHTYTFMSVGSESPLLDKQNENKKFSYRLETGRQQCISL